MRWRWEKKYSKYLIQIGMALACVGVFFVFASRAQAAGDHIVINEIYPAPNSGEKEWVELYNSTLSDVDLLDYSLKDGGVATKNLIGTVDAGEYFVYEVSSGWLNNSGDILSLIYKPTNTIVDQIIYGDWDDNQDNQPLAPTVGRSLSRFPNGSDTNDDKKDFRVLSLSKGAENVLPIYSSSIIVNEIVPQPITGSADEFIEIYNLGVTDVNLSGWQIDDIENGGSSPYTIPDGTVILAGGYITFYNFIDHISLNDSGDFARLVDPNGEERTAVYYSTSKRGQSFSKFTSGWQWTTILTPAKENILQIEAVTSDTDQDIPLVDILFARQSEAGKVVSVIGTITILPNRLSSQYFYIQDDSAGIQIYCYKKDFPNLNLGDLIQVEGEISDYYGDKRIKIKQALDIKVIGSSHVPEVTSTTIDEIGDEMVGEVVEVEGTVTETSGSTFYIEGSGEIKVNIREETGINKPRMSRGDRVRIVGVVSKYKGSYQILPFEQSGVTILSSGNLPKGGKPAKNQKSSLIYYLALWNLLPKARSKQKKLLGIWQRNLNPSKYWRFTVILVAVKPFLLKDWPKD